ncbi:class I SAM-dependent methyltransferase [Nocardiaceae bacterium YC2-7]|uniref:Class I SAM-dependent methyltransferase n=1 Tax=Antrihabitans stalactiti TaxID=2584121 RepID=A0A848KL51_9NOCA|nr:class I SAM-dependent methyltransferase [Antrihabitans stalactiti]
MDIALAPATVLAAGVLGFVRAVGVTRLPLCRRVLRRIGVFPIINHYYEPLFDPRKLRHSLDEERNLPGFDMNTDEQLRILDLLHFGEEVKNLPRSKTSDLEFHLDNDMFFSGDAEYFYNMIRHHQPRTIVEIGSGSSTLIGLKAVRKNRELDPSYQCNYICIEPYEVPWLETTGVTVIRKTVEVVPMATFEALQPGDILFIDSSHILRPQGDVLFEYLELLPSLPVGVIVHIHDIFSPRDYPQRWVVDEVRLWNEQYLLEAFLTSNHAWKIIGALNYLQHNYHDRLRVVCPSLTPHGEPASLYLQKIR